MPWAYWFWKCILWHFQWILSEVRNSNFFGTIFKMVIILNLKNIMFSNILSRNVWPSWFLTIGHELIKIKIWSNAPTVKIRANVLLVNVTNYSPNVFCSSRTVSNGNIICSGQEEHQKDNSMWNEDANQLEIQMQIQIGPVAGIQMDLQHFSMQQNKNVAKIFL